jgi:hypothetical protein
MKVGILSDTHGFMNPALEKFFESCDELWHAGDWGSAACVEAIRSLKPVKGVYGNIDGAEIRAEFPEVWRFDMEGMHICIMHIAGHPGRYSPGFRQQLNTPPHIDLLICGHSHILKVMRDKKNGLMYMNPGAAGRSGFHQVSTALRLDIQDKRLSSLEVWEQKR